MLKAHHSYFLLNDEVKSTKEYNPNLLKSGISIYEVSRCIEGKDLFIEAHLDRLFESSKKLKFDLWMNRKAIVAQMNKLKEINNIYNGNIEIVFHQSERGKHFKCLFIEDRYPSAEMYSNGVSSSLFEAERNNPTAKQINIHLREKTVKNIKENEVFEIILVDKNANITEGSRSNVFFIKNDEIYTAPKDTVLPGIMRDEVIKICNTNNIKVDESQIAADDLESFEAAFFTGTSPKAIAISNIGDLNYQANHKILIKVLNLFEQRIQEYLNE